MLSIKGQTMLDVALQEGGAAMDAFGIALLNNISITEALEPSTELLTIAVSNTEVYKSYQAKSIKPATGVIPDWFTEE